MRAVHCFQSNWPINCVHIVIIQWFLHQIVMVVPYLGVSPFSREYYLLSDTCATCEKLQRGGHLVFLNILILLSLTPCSLYSRFPVRRLHFNFPGNTWRELRFHWPRCSYSMNLRMYFWVWHVAGACKSSASLPATYLF